MTGASVRAFVGLGSNLQDPIGQVRRALDELDDIPATHRLAISSLYRSPPHGPAEQPHFVNAVAELNTRLSAETLLAELLTIEKRHGRVRRERWGPRTLDLDLLIFGERRLRTATLTVPHPEISRRAFVVMPLSEIAPSLVVPGEGRLADLLEAVDTAGLERLEA